MPQANEQSYDANTDSASSWYNITSVAGSIFRSVFSSAGPPAAPSEEYKTQAAKDVTGEETEVVSARPKGNRDSCNLAMVRKSQSEARDMSYGEIAETMDFFFGGKPILGKLPNPQ
jgi:hypothetical protein